MLKEIIERAMEEVKFKEIVRKELETQYGQDYKAMDWGQIIAVVLPIVIKAFMDYVLPYLINNVIPWIIDKLTKKSTTQMILSFLRGQTPSWWKSLL